MKSFKILCLALGLTLFASVAMGGQATSYRFGTADKVLLIRSQNTIIDQTARCVDFIEDVTASIVGEACGNDDVNEIVWPQNAQVTQVKIRQTIASDASDVCDVELEVAGTEVATANVTMSTSALAVVTADLFYDLADGDAVGISLNTGTSCMSGASPEVIVELWGRWVSDSAF